MIKSTSFIPSVKKLQHAWISNNLGKNVTYLNLQAKLHLFTLIEHKLDLYFIMDTGNARLPDKGPLLVNRDGLDYLKEQRLLEPGCYVAPVCLESADEIAHTYYTRLLLQNFIKKD
jgi:predicted solute-binding protein